MGRKTGRRGLFGRRKESDLQVLPYCIRDHFLSPEQATYFKMILSAVGDTFAVCPRVYLADIISVPQDEADHFMEKLNGIQIDFLMCDKDTLQPLVAVVLSGETDITDDWRDREYFLDDVFEAAKLPLVRLFIGNPCSSGDLRECLLEAAESAGSKSLDGRFPGNWLNLEKTAPVEKFAPEQQPEQNYPESENHAEDSPQEAVLKLEDLQPEPATVEKTHLAFEWDESVPEEEQQPPEDLRQPQVEFSPSEEQVPIEIARKFIIENYEEKSRETEPLPRPAVLRFLHSEQEQTPGIDFFTGSISDIAPPQVEDKNGKEAGDNEFGQVKSNDTQSDREAPKNEAKEPDTFFSAELPDLEQLKAKMKQEVEMAARQALQSGAPSCPRCSTTMVLRTSRRGYRFYVCSNYPHCREVRGLYE